jgi:uncharacterized membrane protein
VSSLAAPPRSPRRTPLKYVLFAFVAAMFGYVLATTERFLFDANHPEWAYYGKFGWPLVIHGVAGTLALLLGFTQFSSRLRAARPALHRLGGRLYVVAVLITAPLGVLIQFQQEADGLPRSFTVAALFDAGLWLLATALAYSCIRARRIEAHRRWMMRSYAMALVFLEVRVILGLTGWAALGPAVVEPIVWACIALAYPLADLALEVQERLRARSRAAPVA